MVCLGTSSRGCMLQAMIDDGKLELLQEMYKMWPFFGVTLDMIEMVFAKVGLTLLQCAEILSQTIAALKSEQRQSSLLSPSQYDIDAICLVMWRRLVEGGCPSCPSQFRYISNVCHLWFQISISFKSSLIDLTYTSLRVLERICRAIQEYQNSMRRSLLTRSCGHLVKTWGKDINRQSRFFWRSKIMEDFWDPQNLPFYSRSYVWEDHTSRPSMFFR